MFILVILYIFVSEGLLKQQVPQFWFKYVAYFVITNGLLSPVYYVFLRYELKKLYFFKDLVEDDAEENKKNNDRRYRDFQNK